MHPWPWRGSEDRGPLGLALLGLLTLASCNPAERPPERVVLVTIDTLRADRLGFYGYPRETTPFLDRLAAESVVFTRVVASMSHTAPSHASMFTGLHPEQHRLLRNGEPLSERVETLAGVLQRTGFRTAAFTPVGFLDGLKAGFDDFHSSGEYRPAHRILEAAAAWMRSRPDGERTFVWVHLFDVHQWHVDDVVDRPAVEEATALEPAGEALVSYLERYRGIPRTSFASTDDYLRVQNSYDGQLLSVDRQLEGFFGGLQEVGLDRKALWIVTADHGEGLGNHGHRGHGKYIYNEQLLVPLIVSFRDRRLPPRVVETQVQLVDLAPTLAEWLEVSLAQPGLPLAGRSLTPLLDGGDSEWDQRAFSQRRPADDRRVAQGWTPQDLFALQDGSFKVIARSGGGQEIYDLGRDPLELEDLSGAEGIELSLLADLKRRIDAMRRQAAQIERGEIEPSHVEELRALGYL